MNFRLSDEQRMIKDTAHDLLGDRISDEQLLAHAAEPDSPSPIWEEVAELGWAGIHLPEEEGGQDLGVIGLALIQEELGYALAPSPLLANAAATLLLSAAGRGAELEPLALGAERGTVALLDDKEQPVRTEKDSGATLLNGTKVAVIDAAGADAFVVDAAGGHYLVRGDAAGVEIAPAAAMDPLRRLYTVSFDRSPAEPLDLGEEAATDAYAAISVAVAAESVGIAQRATDLSVGYARERQQFGHPIGAYQAVAHRCADMYLRVAGSRSAVHYAAWALDERAEDRRRAASVAKAYACESARDVTLSAVQVHGGVGFTWEYVLHLYLKRAMANAYAFGQPSWHRKVVADAIGLRGGLK